MPAPSKLTQAQDAPPSRTQARSKAAAQLSPEYHNIMLRHSLSPITIRALTSLPRAAEPQEILRCASSATELRSFLFHPFEKGAFSGINNDPSTRWPIKETLGQPWHKAFLVAQCEAAGGDYGERLSLTARKDLLSTKPKIVKTLGHVLRACADIMGVRKDAVVPDIGPKKVKTLVESGILTVRHLAQLEFFHIERLLSRNPPFGHKIVQTLAHFPRLVLAVDIPKRNSSDQGLVVRAVLGCSNVEVPVWKESVPWVNLAAEINDGRLVFFWRGRAKSLMEGKELVFPVEATPSQTVFVWVSCEEIAGTVVTAEVTV
nr:ATP-dependent DNA helicase HFM1 [Colletotrichum truncatum]KAF6801935.1 ATP-dependent DNA helicase HFM1 [Colletotrichum truncatum]